MEKFQPKTKVQALCPETKHWIHGTIVESNKKKSKVSWLGYDKESNCWVQNENIRVPVNKRTLLMRNAIKKSNFPNRGDPKRLELGDEVCQVDDRESKEVVAINDPFNAKVNVPF